MFLIADNMDKNIIISLILEFKSGVFLILTNLNLNEFWNAGYGF